jgi:hypothetical protein
MNRRVRLTVGLGGMRGATTKPQAVVAFPHAATLHQCKPNVERWMSRSSLQGWRDRDHRRSQPERRSDVVVPQPR